MQFHDYDVVCNKFLQRSFFSGCFTHISLSTRYCCCCLWCKRAFLWHAYNRNDLVSKQNEGNKRIWHQVHELNNGEKMKQAKIAIPFVCLQLGLANQHDYTYLCTLLRCRSASALCVNGCCMLQFIWNEMLFIRAHHTTPPRMGENSERAVYSHRTMTELVNIKCQVYFHRAKKTAIFSPPFFLFPLLLFWLNSCEFLCVFIYSHERLCCSLLSITLLLFTPHKQRKMMELLNSRE